MNPIKGEVEKFRGQEDQSKQKTENQQLQNVSLGVNENEVEAEGDKFESVPLVHHKKNLMGRKTNLWNFKLTTENWGTEKSIIFHQKLNIQNHILIQCSMPSFAVYNPENENEIWMNFLVHPRSI